MKITDNALADQLDRIVDGTGQTFLEMLSDEWGTGDDNIKSITQKYLRKFAAYKNVTVTGVITHGEDDMPEDGSYFTWEIELG